jgi:hypothetical protein
MCLCLDHVFFLLVLVLGLQSYLTVTYFVDHGFFRLAPLPSSELSDSVHTWIIFSSSMYRIDCRLRSSFALRDVFFPAFLADGSYE